jgi:phosphate transport system protein
LVFVQTANTHCSSGTTSLVGNASARIVPAAERDETMREVFQQELREVQQRLVEISTLVANSIENATKAFNQSDVSLAETVIADDDKIDALTVSLDELAINILARQQPVARDLRIVVSALRISASLERMGDMSEHIAQLARYRFPEKVVPKTLRGTFAEMGKLDVEVARKLTELLKTEDVRLAEEIRSDDDKIDDLHLSVFDKVLGETWKGGAEDTVDATLASRYHERFADHAVSIAKKVQYLATGDWHAPSA